jgi:hypothetical protein
MARPIMMKRIPWRTGRNRPTIPSPMKMAWALIIQEMDKIKTSCGLPFIQQRGIILTFEYLSLFSV